MADANKTTATLRRQVQHQADLIKRLRDSSYQDHEGGGGDDDDGGGGAAVAARIREGVEAAEETARAAVEEAARLTQRLAETERELQRMERRAAAAAAEAGVRGEGADGAARLGKSGMDSLSLSLASRGGGGGGGGGGDGAARLEQENRRLAEENDKLSRELQAFDLDFFEEIEDLKYKYSEAARKLRQYE